MDLLGIIFPKRCVRCGRIGTYFCNKCINSIRIIQTNETICPVCEKPAIDGVTHPRCRGKYTLDGLTSFFHYDGPVRQAIKSIKYRFVSDLADEFVNCIPLTSYNMIKQRVDNWQTIVVPIPLHSSRLRFRGFNQAKLLGFRIAKLLKFRPEPGILSRIKATTPQVEMKNRRQRLQNMDGVFAVNREKLDLEHIDGVIFFDDVFTTGATMRAATSVLKHAGVQFVWALTMAR